MNPLHCLVRSLSAAAALVKRPDLRTRAAVQRMSRDHRRQSRSPFRAIFITIVLLSRRLNSRRTIGSNTCQPHPGVRKALDGWHPEPGIRVPREGVDIALRHVARL